MAHIKYTDYCWEMPMAGSKVAVLKIESDGTVWVRPVLEGMCISCESAGTCAKRGTPYKVVNPANFPVCAGDMVSLASSSKAKIVQGLYALLFPVAFAVVGYAYTPAIAGLAGIVAGEGLRAFGVLVFLFAASGIVLVTRKFAKKWVRPEITGVEEK
jgi:positive regulator of sigma E activity